MHGVSRKTVTQWKHEGRVVFNETGVDVTESDRLLQDAGYGRFRVTDPKPERAEPIDPNEATVFLRDLLVGRFHSQAEAERIKENALAGLRTLELQQKSGALIEMSFAETTFFNMARAERDAWMNWPARVGPALAAEYDLPADRVTASLVALVHAELAARGEPEADFDGSEN